MFEFVLRRFRPVWGSVRDAILGGFVSCWPVEDPEPPPYKKEPDDSPALFKCLDCGAVYRLQGFPLEDIQKRSEKPVPYLPTPNWGPVATEGRVNAYLFDADRDRRMLLDLIRRASNG